jgi:exonuclease SbcC
MTLCVDVTIQKPGGLGILLLDGAERLDKKSRDELYAKCKEKGLQLIATRVTDSDDLEVTEI